LANPQQEQQKQQEQEAPKSCKYHAKCKIIASKPCKYHTKCKIIASNGKNRTKKIPQKNRTKKIPQTDPQAETTGRYHIQGEKNPQTDPKKIPKHLCTHK